MVYYSEMIRIEFSKSKRHIEWSLREIRKKLPALLSQWCLKQLVLPATMCKHRSIAKQRSPPEP